jgi:hypothetical protein
MKYSPTHRLFFVHIPKCAGLSVYRGLEPIADFPWETFAADVGLPLDEIHARVTPFGFDHPILGSLHQAHLPLPLMQSHFPRCLDLLRGAEQSFAVLRDPRQRFMSALMQNLREFGGLGAVSIGAAELRTQAAVICETLRQDPNPHSLELIHFARQTDFVCLDDKRLMTRLFTMDNLKALERWLGDTYGAGPFLEESRNRSRMPRGGVSYIQPVVKKAASVLLTEGLRKKLHPLWIKSPLYRKAAESYDTMDLGADTEAFIAEHYAGDAALYHGAKRAMAELA